jgi:hypothetical protein
VCPRISKYGKYWCLLVFQGMGARVWPVLSSVGEIRLGTGGHSVKRAPVRTSKNTVAPLEHSNAKPFAFLKRIEWHSKFEARG